MDALALATAASSLAAACCPSCGGSSFDTIYKVGSIPLHSCVLLDTPEAAKAFPRRDLELALCRSCGFVFNAIFDEAAMTYSANFEESQHFSETFSSFAKDLAAEIDQRCGSSGKRILEIGCGKGEFLVQFCAHGAASGIGIDPAYRADPGRTFGSTPVRFLAEPFGPQHYSLEPDIVLCRHTFEHIGAVQDFLCSVRQMIGEREDVRVVFETPDFARVLRTAAFWDIYYEHCSYFTAGTHSDIFERTGFRTESVELVYGGQYIIHFARPKARPSSPTKADPRVVTEMLSLAHGFEERARRSQSLWYDRIQSAAREGRGVVLWGGGSKAVSLSTTLGLDSEIRAVVDVNPYKQGKYLPGSGHYIVGPEAVSFFDPGLVIVMNPVYRNEIARQLSALGIQAEIESLH